MQKEIKTKIAEKQRGIVRNIQPQPFKKTDREIGLLHQFKKEHNKEFHKIFGTKRPTAGVVRRYMTETKFA